MFRRVLLAALALACAVLVRAQTSSNPQPAARRLFTAHCASCHGADGKETEGGPPPLEGSRWLSGPESRVIKIVLHGVRGDIEVNGKNYNLEMPGFARVLSDADVAALVTFVRATWGALPEPVTEERVRRIRAATAERSDYWTAEELARDP